MKNYTLVETTYKGVKSWKLLNNQGDSIEFFELFARTLIKKYSRNTRLSYCRNVALFIDYLEEINQVYKNTAFTKSFLVDSIESFPQWLMYGSQSGDDIAKTINNTYPSAQYSRPTIDLIMAGVRLFLSVSERIRVEQENLGHDVDSKLFPEIYASTQVTAHQRRSLIKNSMLAGVISGGPQLLKTCVLPIQTAHSYFSLERAFPFDKIIPLIESFSYYRDKALYMLCAASGCRIHEALQILIEDIDIKNRSILLVNPNSRITHSSYQTLTAQEKSQLSWKGRETNRTLLIQPFGDLFFEYLEQYIKKEYIPHNKNSFVFQHVRGKLKGKPFFLSNPSTRYEAFTNAVDAIGLGQELSQGVHSLRHMYGSYLVNYFPRSDGTFGLNVSIVQKIMGHATLNATQKYARHDQSLLAVELEFANSLLYTEKDEKINLLGMKRKALQSQLLELEKQYNEL